MKHKTAMMELIDYMKANFHLTDESLEVFEQLLEKEKEQIIDAIEHEFIGESEYNWWSAGFNGLGDKYYNETYKQD